MNVKEQLEKMRDIKPVGIKLIHPKKHDPRQTRGPPDELIEDQVITVRRAKDLLAKGTEFMIVPEEVWNKEIVLKNGVHKKIKELLVHDEKDIFKLRFEVRANEME